MSIRAFGAGRYPADDIFKKEKNSGGSSADPMQAVPAFLPRPIRAPRGRGLYLRGTDTTSCWLPRLSCGATAHPNTSSPPILVVTPSARILHVRPAGWCPCGPSLPVTILGFARGSVQNPCTRSGSASNRLVLCTASDEVPNSISNHTLQAMIAARRTNRGGTMPPKRQTRGRGDPGGDPGGDRGGRQALPAGH